MSQPSVNNAVHSVTLDERKKATLSGANEVLSYSEEELVVATTSGNLTIKGKNIKIVKFGAQENTLCFTGEIDSLKYATAKAPLIKRIFKWASLPFSFSPSPADYSFVLRYF